MPRGYWRYRCQLHGVVDVDPESKTAKGRWQGWMIDARPVGGILRQTWGHGVYECEYIKENGKWLFQNLHFNFTFYAPYEDGWLKTPMYGTLWREGVADAPSTTFHPYPSGYCVPYHFKHPITGEW